MVSSLSDYQGLRDEVQILSATTYHATGVAFDRSFVIDHVSQNITSGTVSRALENARCLTKYKNTLNGSKKLVVRLFDPRSNESGTAQCRGCLYTGFCPIHQAAKDAGRR